MLSVTRRYGIYELYFSHDILFFCSEIKNTKNFSVKIYSEKPNDYQKSRERKFSGQHELDRKLITALITSVEKENTSKTPLGLTHKATEF